MLMRVPTYLMPPPENSYSTAGTCDTAVPSSVSLWRVSRPDLSMRPPACGQAEARRDSATFINTMTIKTTTTLATIAATTRAPVSSKGAGSLTMRGSTSGKTNADNVMMAMAAMTPLGGVPVVRANAEAEACGGSVHSRRCASVRRH